jgi:hypothetical protein
LSPKKTKKASFRPRLESLERRDLMTGLTAVLSSGVLTVSGTSTGTYQINETTSAISVTGVTGSFAVSSVKSIVVNLDSGNDLVELNSASVKGQVALTVPLTINSGAGNDTVLLANATDVYFSGTGNALAVTATGTATLNGAALTWADQNIHTAAIRSLVKTDAAAGALTRTEMIALMTKVESAGAVTATEFSDLTAIANDAALYGTNTYVQVLTDDIVLGNAANATYLGTTLGNLASGSSATTLTDLTDKWFLGTDLPVATTGLGTTYTYAAASGTLFGASGPLYTDVCQGELGDCYFLSGLAATAKSTPSVITSMFIVNGDGTYTVRFYTTAGKADYVTVNNQLPVDQYGDFVMDGLGYSASSTANVLWVALAEKAFVEWHQTGKELAGGTPGGPNNYDSINVGLMGVAMTEITDRTNQSGNSFTPSSAFTNFVADYNAGSLFEFNSMTTPPLSTVVGNHAYAVVGYNATTQSITLFNPWGATSGTTTPELITLSWAQVQANFLSWDRVI